MYHPTLLPHDMLESITNSRIGSKLSTAIFSLLLNAMLSDVKEQHGKDSAPGIIASIDQKFFANDFYNLDTAAPTKSGGVLAHAVAHHGLDIIISPKVDFRGDNGRTAHFEDISFMGREAKDVKEFDLEVDLIILCTGFRMSFNWLDVGEGNAVEVNPRKWFKVSSKERFELIKELCICRTYSKSFISTAFPLVSVTKWHALIMPALRREVSHNARRCWRVMQLFWCRGKEHSLQTTQIKL